MAADFTAQCKQFSRDALCVNGKADRYVYTDIYLYSPAQYCQNSIKNIMGHVRHERYLFETAIVNNVIVNFHQRYYYLVRWDRPAVGCKPRVHYNIFKTIG